MSLSRIFEGRLGRAAFGGILFVHVILVFHIAETTRNFYLSIGSKEISEKIALLHYYYIPLMMLIIIGIQMRLEEDEAFVGRALDQLVSYLTINTKIIIIQ